MDKRVDRGLIVLLESLANRALELAEEAIFYVPADNAWLAGMNQELSDLQRELKAAVEE